MPSGNAHFGSLRHLAGRFAGSLWPLGPGREGEAWAQQWLTPAEREVWRRLPPADRRHAVGVARTVVASVPRRAVRSDVVAAALLHDAGKVEAGLGTWGRTAATAAAVCLGRDRVGEWAARGRWPGRAGRYVTHDRLGADLLTEAGSADLVVRWAREHHLPADQWTVDAELGAALKAADGD